MMREVQDTFDPSNAAAALSEELRKAAGVDVAEDRLQGAVRRLWRF